MNTAPRSDAICAPLEAHVSGASIPFARRMSDAEVRTRARELAQALNLQTDVRIVEGNGRAGLEQERRFRLAWWTHGVEPLRAALQTAKRRAHRQAEIAGASTQLTEAWRRAERFVGSTAWRERLRELTRGRNVADADFLRLAFRAAQQAWSREARWRASLPVGTASPFAPLIELFEGGAWPLGCRDGTLRVFVWNSDADDVTDSISASMPDGASPSVMSSLHPSTPTREIFLSARFKDSALTARWENSIREWGWTPVHGAVSEEDAAPEVQLAARIRRSRAVVGILDERDPDFDLPWWMFQELDYGRASRLPVFLVIERGDAAGAHVQRIEGELAGETTNDESEIRHWLQTIANELRRT